MRHRSGGLLSFHAICAVHVLVNYYYLLSSSYSLAIWLTRVQCPGGVWGIGRDDGEERKANPWCAVNLVTKARTHARALRAGGGQQSQQREEKCHGHETFGAEEWCCFCLLLRGGAQTFCKTISRRLVPRLCPSFSDSTRTSNLIPVWERD